MESQIRHPHPLNYVACHNGITEYVCPLCAECYYQYTECQ